MGQGLGGQGCSLSILARKATNVLAPPRHRRASARSMGEGLIVILMGGQGLQGILSFFFFLIGG